MYIGTVFGGKQESAEEALLLVSPISGTPSKACYIYVYRSIESMQDAVHRNFIANLASNTNTTCYSCVFSHKVKEMGLLR